MVRAVNAGSLLVVAGLGFSARLFIHAKINRLTGNKGKKETNGI